MVVKIVEKSSRHCLTKNLKNCNIESTTPSPINTSSSTELSPDESQPAVNPDETTMWSVTLNRNETFEAISSTESSSTEDYGTRLNETSTMANPTTVDIGTLSYKQSNYHSLTLLLKFFSINHVSSLRQANVPRGENRWRCESFIWPLAMANFTETVENVDLFAQMRKCFA